MNAGGLPSRRRIEAALRVTTERLARELVSPQPRAPDWSPVEWDVARAVAAIQGISVLLANRLRWQGPGRWSQFLAEQCDHGLRRDEKIGQLLPRLDAALRSHGTGAIALKGAALRGLNVYQPGERPMGDIDLLVRPQDQSAVTRALASLGYDPLMSMRRHVVFGDSECAAPHGFGEHIDNPLKIELHTRIGDPLPATTLDITSRLLPAAVPPGLSGYADMAALLAHLLLHAAGNMRAHALRLVQLYDLALLLPRMSDADWSGLLHGHEAGPWWLLPPLLLTRRYFGCAPPAPVMSELSRACPAALRRAAHRYDAYEVSWSNLRIAAFPGIEWSRTAGEALRYARSRIAPDRTARDELKLFTRAQPQVAAIPWYTLAHRARMLRWIFSRPPRAQTMSSVYAALTSD